MKKKILFVNAILENNTPRSIRTLNFIKHLKNEYDVHILYFQFRKVEIKIEGVITHTIGLINEFKRIFLASKTKNIFSRLVYKIMNSPNRLKDPYYFDIKNLSKEIEKLDSQYEFDNKIISVSPFSMFKLAEYIDISNFTFDIGDHLYRNSAIKNSQNKFFYQTEKKALRAVNQIIVTNKKTKEFYIENYNLDKDKINVISQGFDKELIDRINKDSSKNKSNDDIIRLVYGGRFYKGLRDPNLLVNAVQDFNSSNPQIKIRFDIYGGQGISIKEGNGVSIYPSINQKELFKEIINSNYNVFIDNRVGIQTPGKIYENLALGTPILFVKSPSLTKSFELVKDCMGVEFVENNYGKIFELLSKLTIEKKEIKCNFELSQYSWKNISLKVIN